MSISPYYNLTLRLFTIIVCSLVIDVRCKTQTSAQHCSEVSYAVDACDGALDETDVKLLNCGRVRRAVEAVSAVPPTNITYSVTTNTANGHTNVSATNVHIVPIVNTNVTANATISTPINEHTVSTITTPTPKVLNVTKIFPDKPAATQAPSVSPTVKTLVPEKNNAPQNPTKIDLKIPIHNLGENGSGILPITRRCNYNDSSSNATNHRSACVSEPLLPDEGNSSSSEINLDDFVKPAEKLFGEHNVTHYKTDYHSYYNSTLIIDKKEFDIYWDTYVTSNLSLYEILSDAHKKAVKHALNFVFPFYGQPLDGIVVTTGGFLFTGPNIHFWLSATHYIAPLMANFETTYHDDSIIKFYDNGTCMTVLWANLTLHDVPNSGKFTFATTICDNGNITFAYKDLPLRIEEIPTDNHPVKIGLSDAYEVDRIDYFIRNKMILEYHQIDFKNQTILNNTLIHLVPLPTCPQYNTCKSCLDNDSQFKCAWCSKVQRCSSGLDRLEQEWYIQNCYTDRVENSSMCSDFDNIPVNPRINTNKNNKNVSVSEVPNKNFTVTDGLAATASEPSSSSSGGIIACLMALVVLGGLVAWVVYAYRNPHTNSGQLLIKYRPSQWSWRRGEARYTAATIHM